MRYDRLAKTLKAWIEAFDEPIQFWTDAPGVDWHHVSALFDSYGWPGNLVQEPWPLVFTGAQQDMRFQEAVEDAFASFNPALRRHHALDDAIANRHGYLKAMARAF